MIGKKVPHKIVKQTASRQDIVEQETGFAGNHALPVCARLEVGPVLTRKKLQTASVNPMKTRNQVPMEDCAKA